MPLLFGRFCRRRWSLNDVNYLLEVFRDAALSERVERLSLSARSDEIAL